MKAPTRGQVLDLLEILAATATTAAGFALGALGQETIMVIGLNLTSNIIHGRWPKLKERWLSSNDGALNHDIQKALARAFEEALTSIETKYFDLQAGALPKEEKKYIRQLFRQLKEQARSGFLASLQRVTQEQAVKDYLYEAEETVKGKLWQRIDETNLLPAENEDLKKFLRDNLFVELQFWFGEELKTDNKESNRAWRAFQRLLLEGIQAEVQAVRESQTSIQQDLQEIQQDLQKLASLGDRLEQLREAIDRRSQDEPVQQGLEKAVEQIRTRLEELYRIARRTEEKVDAANTKLDFIIDTLDGPGIEHHTAFVNTAPPMPPNFVPRREELDELRRAVIGDRNTGPVALTGLRGMGGIGKTALAIALCHDDGLQETFSDGVIWVDIGREPGNLAGKMRRVGQALGDGPGYYDTPEAGADRLRLLLKDKAVLLVLDDVWDARHVEPFIVEAPRCRVLFTTRNADIALGLDAREIPLDVLAPEQAISLLREWADRDDPALPDIAKRLGSLPLALKLAGARLRGGMSGAEWLKTFQRVSQIKLSRRSTDPQENLLVSFELSVRELPVEDRRLYYALGIFPEDVQTPQSVVARLWRQLSPELSRFDCDELVTELAQLALIEQNADDRTVTLHDLLREYTREQLGDELAATHAALLSAYNPDGKPWPRIEHDGYLYYHLAYHLREARRKEELYELLIGSPDWMEAKFVACTGDTAYVTDLDLAIGDFADPLPAPEVLMSVKLHAARQVVNARVSSYTDTDLRTLVWLGREDEALAHARLRSGTKDKVDSLLAVYGSLKEQGQPNPSLLNETREIARTIENDWKRADALSAVASALAQEGRYEEVREVASIIEGDSKQAVEELRFFLASALGVVAFNLTQEGRYEEALEVASIIEGDDWQRAWALNSLASALAQAGDESRANTVFSDALEVANAIEDGSKRSEALRDLASALAQEGRCEEAREVADTIEDDGKRAQALSAVATGLVRAGDESQANAVFDEAREVASSIEYNSDRTEALSSLASALIQAGRYEEARKVAGGIEGGRKWLDALSSLASVLMQAGRYEEAREVISTIGYEVLRSEALSSVAAVLAQAGDESQANAVFSEARKVAISIEYESARSDALTSLAMALVRVGRYEEAREVAGSIEHGWERSDVLSSVATALAQAGDERRANAVFGEARGVAISIEYDWARTKALSSLASALTQLGRYEEAREIASSIQEYKKRSEALSSLVSALVREGRYKEARDIASAIEYDYPRVDALRDLVSALAQAGDDHRANAVFGEVREVVSSIENDGARVWVLRDLASALMQAGRYEEALEAARSIEDHGRFGQRGSALKDLRSSICAGPSGAL